MKQTFTFLLSVLALLLLLPGYARAVTNEKITFTWKVPAESLNKGFEIFATQGIDNLTIDWGDTDTETISGEGRDRAAIGIKSYTSAGTYTVTITAEAGSQFFKLSSYRNKLTALDVSGCTELTEIYCHDNELTDLKFPGCTKLTRLECHKNQLTSLDVSKCTELTMLLCNDNDLTTLDVSACTKLTILDCFKNKLTALKVTGCNKMTGIRCNNNSLTALDVSGCTELTALDCSYNKLTSLKVTGCNKLEMLNCGFNKLTTLDISECPELSDLQCAYNDLITLDVSKCTKLTILYCHGNLLTTLDVSKCPELKWFICSINKLTTLDVSACPKLETLKCKNNKLTTLDVSKCPNLTTLETDPEVTVIRPSVAVYHTIRLTRGAGITSNYSPGSMVFEDGGYLYLTFTPDDRSLTADDILLVVDGEEVTFGESNGLFYYFINPIEENHDVTLALRRYPVTLTLPEGADPDALTLESPATADYGKPYMLRLRLAPAYDPAHLALTLNGESLSFNCQLKGDAPIAGDGTLFTATIDNVEGPLDLVVTSLGEAVGNLSIAPGDIQIAMDNGQWTIDNAGIPTTLYIYTLAGRLHLTQALPTGTTTVALPAGAYILRTGKTTHKLLVR